MGYGTAVDVTAPIHPGFPELSAHCEQAVTVPAGESSSVQEHGRTRQQEAPHSGYSKELPGRDEEAKGEEVAEGVPGSYKQHVQRS